MLMKMGIVNLIHCCRPRWDVKNEDATKGDHRVLGKVVNTVSVCILERNISVLVYFDVPFRGYRYIYIY